MSRSAALRQPDAAASPFAGLSPAPLDPVLVSIEQFAADPRPNKINLGVGMYYDEKGRVPLLGAVAEAERRLAADPAPWNYTVPEGTAAFRHGVEKLLFGADSALVAAGRVATVQGIGGTGAIKLGAHLLAEMAPDAVVAISDPSWVNHPPLFVSAGFATTLYPYVDPTSGRLAFEAMVEALRAMEPGTIVVLHTCCHNPTGIDLTHDQWRALVPVLREGRLIPFLDLAYQGFGDGLATDAYPVRLLAEADLPVFVALSFSKCFALYGERVGALSVVTGSPDETRRVMGALKNIVRAIYSTPPSHGGMLVSTVLADPALEQSWLDELERMRLRIVAMRHALVDRLKGDNRLPDFSFILSQRGLFSFSGLTPAEIAKLRDEHAVHAVANGRLCMAALNEGNIDRVAEAIRAVLVETRA